MQDTLPDRLPVAERHRRPDQGGGTAADGTPAAPERRIRALVIADSCNPEWESIPLVGWSHANALRAHVDVHIATRSWNAEALTRAGLVEDRDFTALNTEALFNPMQRLVQRISGPNKGWAMLTALSIPSYLWLEHLLWRRLGPDLRAGRFDLVHRITPLSPAVPSPIAGHCRRLGIPFILGPLNGGLPWPPSFPGLRGQEGEFLSHLREAHRLLPGYRATRRRASAIVIGSNSALADLPKRWHAKSVYVPENGIELARFPAPAPRTPESYRNRPLRAVFLGRLVPYKGADMLIEAAAPFLADGRLTLQILGFGPEREPLEQLVARLGLAGPVGFSGKISHHDVARWFADADLLTFPSVHEFGGAVVLEAMAMGVVPVVVNYGGPAELVSPSSGFLLPMGTREQVVAALRQTLERIINEPQCLASRSAMAISRARGLFAWSSKARQTLEVYRWVLGLRADKPDQSLPFADPSPVAAAPEPLSVAAVAP
jgi:glycosyltransferase involved in cell wall biosynthesis